MEAINCVHLKTLPVDQECLNFSGVLSKLDPLMIDHANNFLSGSPHSTGTAFNGVANSGSGDAMVHSTEHKCLSFASHAPYDGIANPKISADIGHVKSSFPKSTFGSSRNGQTANQGPSANSRFSRSANPDQQNVDGQQGVPANPNAPIVFLVPTKGIGGFGGMPKMVQLPSLYSFDMGSLVMAASLTKVGNRILADHYF